jgi:hypothetical protein
MGDELKYHQTFFILISFDYSAFRFLGFYWIFAFVILDLLHLGTVNLKRHELLDFRITLSWTTKTQLRTNDYQRIFLGLTPKNVL